MAREAISIDDVLSLEFKRSITSEELATLDFSMFPQTQEFPATQFYGKEWLTGTATMAMTPEQRGGYIDLLAHAWDQKPPCSLPDDPSKLAGYSRLGVARWKKVGAFVREQFVKCSDGRLRNLKQINVWLAMIKLREKRRNSSKKDRLVDTNNPFCSDKRRRLSTPSIEAEDVAAAEGTEKQSGGAGGCDDSQAAILTRILGEVCPHLPADRHVFAQWLSCFPDPWIVAGIILEKFDYVGQAASLKYITKMIRERVGDPGVAVWSGSAEEFVEARLGSGAFLLWKTEGRPLERASA